ncbi:MAG: hypothetical protein A2X94_04930 [Bdellovibrionales bacterium GWB1_55_8]|nr:MAG: hypothetical protein A2X94_04930 [Bdellovibrionales bacterium GWB1_55_8]
MKIPTILLIAGLIAFGSNGPFANASELSTQNEVITYLKELERSLFGSTTTIGYGTEICPFSIMDHMENVSLSGATLGSSEKLANKFWDEFKTKHLEHIEFKLKEKFPEWTRLQILRSGGNEKLVKLDDSLARFDFLPGGYYCTDDILRLRGNTVFISLASETDLVSGANLKKGSSVEQSIFALGTALKDIKLLPSQRKILKSFFEAAKRMHEAVETEQRQAAKGEKYKPLMHRDFIAQTTLLVAYYRYLQEWFAESAELSSERSGVDQTNLRAVQEIDVAISNLIESYGLETDLASKQIADYGRVLSDLLLYQLAPLVDETKRRKFIRPTASLLARLVAKSEVNGDLAAEDEVLALKVIWESPGFTQFMSEWLSTTDIKLNGLILNMNSLAYKIGLAVNTQIKVFQKEDIDRLKSEKSRK